MENDHTTIHAQSGGTNQPKRLSRRKTLTVTWSPDLRIVPSNLLILQLLKLTITEVLVPCLLRNSAICKRQRLDSGQFSTVFDIVFCF